MLETILLLSLATYWLAFMIIDTEGPFNIFERLREATKNAKWTKLTCIYCTSMQVSLVLTLMYTVVSGGTIVSYLLLSLAAAGLAVVWAALLGFLETS